MSTRRLKIVAMLILAAGLMGMGRKEAKNQDPPPAPISGVTGKIEIWEGNFMPPIEAETRDKQIKPGANLIVRLYQPVKGLPGAMVETVEGEMVAETTSDEDGMFTIPAKEGTYSIFVQDGEGWYANGWDGNGVQGAVTVEPMKMTEVLIKNTRKATF
ncbi:MAG: hypothetical protein KDB65_05990 [Calditrichaeota bacterium]|nr:hypothetical protein [Calditrichota bacterium]MCB9367769.1 hypothetical protein [Calditrichota bacterium]